MSVVVIILLSAVVLAQSTSVVLGRRGRRLELAPLQCACGHSACYHGPKDGKQAVCHQSGCHCQTLLMPSLIPAARALAERT
jgi:hypothetical protein